MMTGLIALFFTWIHLSSAQEIKEYCEDDMFRASCNENEAVVIETARYGRMRSGRCVTRDYGHMGCSMDVQSHLDRMCSGRMECELLVTSLLHDGSKPCPKDFRSFLEASYKCVPVMTGRREGCYGNRGVEVSAQEGYISSMVTKQTGCGSIDTPWHLRVGSGQRINITLLDFSTSVLSGKESRPAAADVCLVYAIIKESSGAPTQTVCGGRTRVHHVYTSVSNTVEIRLVGKRNQAQDQDTQFMLQYKGCADPQLSPGSWMKRHGNQLEVGCEGEDSKWHLTCDGTRWSGNYHNCTVGSGKAASSIGSVLNVKNIPDGLSIMIIVGVALCVGLFILLIGVVCLRRLRRREEHTYAENLYAKDDGYSFPSQGAVTNLPKGTNAHDDPFYNRNSENDYYRTWQLQNHQSRSGSHMESIPPPAYRSTSGYSTNSEHNVEHVYESPKFDRRDYASSHQNDLADDDVHAKYFELDPEAVSRKSRNDKNLDTASASTPGTRSDNFLISRTQT